MRDCGCGFANFGILVFIDFLESLVVHLVLFVGLWYCLFVWCVCYLGDVGSFLG